MTTPITVTLAEDDLLVRSGLEALLSGSDGVEVVNLCGDLGELLTSIRSRQSDVVLTDIRMPPTGTREGIDAAEIVGEEFPAIGVIVLSQYVDPGLALAVLGDGSRRRGYILKHNVENAEQLCGAIRTVANGGSYIDPDVLNALVEGRKNGSGSGVEQLSAKEFEALERMAQGLNNKAIAEQMFIGERTVEKHISSIFVKLNLRAGEDTHRRVQAVLLYLAHVGASSWPHAPD